MTELENVKAQITNQLQNPKLSHTQRMILEARLDNCKDAISSKGNHNAQGTNG